MKKILFYIAAMAMAVGCSDKIEELDTDGSTDGESILVNLRLTMEDSDDTRVSVDGDSYESAWEAGDVVYLVVASGEHPSSNPMTYDAESGYFSGLLVPDEIYRVYYGDEPFIAALSPTEVSVTTSASPLQPKMVSENRVETPSVDDTTEVDPIEIEMQNMTAVVNLDLTLDLEGIFGSDYANYTTLTIGDITLGGDNEGETQYPTQRFTFLDKGIDEDGFYVTEDGSYINNQTLVGTGASDLALSGDTYIYNIMLHSLPFTIEADEVLPIIFQVELSDDEGNTLITYAAGNITNSTGAAFEVERSKYYTLTKTISASSKGYGTESNPILISTEEDLASIATDATNKATAGVYYKMLNDITLTSENWSPIGTSSRGFQGNFDGGGYTISGLKINNPNSTNQGLFGYAAGATIQNVTLFEPSVVANGFVGALCGMTYSSADGNTIISNCAVVGGSVTCTGDGDGAGTNAYVGGLVGCSYFATFTNCSNSSTVTSSSEEVGGITGYILGYDSSSITSCYNTGDVTSSGRNVGGIVGNNANSVISIKACYNTGDIKSGDSRVGGIAGYNNGSLIACYNVGSISGSSNVGAIVGNNNGTTTPTACYYLSNGDIYDSNYGTEVSSVLALNEAVETMNAECDNSYTAGSPTATHLPSLMGESLSQGDGTEANPFLISSEEDFEDLATLVESNATFTAGKYYEMTQSITLTSDNWVQIGGYASESTSSIIDEKSFQGIFDGKGNTISGLKINADVNFRGLFCSIYNATITNLTISEPSIVSGDYPGAICGTSTTSTISNCRVEGGSVATYSDIGSSCGGIVGRLQFGSTITDCYNSSSVNGYDSVGGVVGTLSDSSMTDCINDGKVDGVSNVGGVVGLSNQSSMTRCYNTESVTGTSDKVGGVVGGISYASYSSSTITSCYNTGDVESDGDYVGGIVGYISFSLTITSCYNTGDVTTDGDYVGGVVGCIDKGSNSFTACYNTGDVDGGDSGSYVGGIVGYVNNNNNSLTACYNTGAFLGYSNLGGVVGGVNPEVDFIHSACYYLTTNTTSSTDYGTKLTTIQMLNNMVGTMNAAAGDGYFTAGDPSDSVIPWLMDKELEYKYIDDNNTLEGYTPGDSLNGDSGL